MLVHPATAKMDAEHGAVACPKVLYVLSQHDVPTGVVGQIRKSDVWQPLTPPHNHFDISTTVQSIAAKLKIKDHHIINKKYKCRNAQKFELLMGKRP